MRKILITSSCVFVLATVGMLAQAWAAPPVCGDGSANGSEDCDGTSFKANKNKCSDHGFAGNNSFVTCNANCTVNTTGCLATDAGTDIGTDVGTDIGTDVGTDIGTDVGTDIGTDIGTTDATTDVGTDIGTDVGTDIGTDVGTDIGTDVGTGGGATCRADVPAIPTVFEAGSLIIPMDTCAQGDLLKAIGLTFFLLKYGIRIAWALDTNKTAIDATDFTVDGGGSLPVNNYARDATDYTLFNTTGVSGLSCMTGNVIEYSGNPFIIPASDAEAALELIYQGTLPEDPTVKFGYANDTANTFKDVVIHKAMVPFTAPIEKVTSTAPKRLAIVSDDGQFDSWIQSFLVSGGLDFPGAGGYDSADVTKATVVSPSHTNFVPGIIYDYVTMSDIANGYLASEGYHVLWMASYSYTNGNATDADGFKTITNFVEDGRAFIAMDTTIASLEQLWKKQGGNDVDDNSDSCPEDGNCTTASRLMTTSGIVEGNAGGGFNTTYPHPASPMLQIGHLDFKGLGGTIKTWRNKEGGAYHDCVQVLATTGSGTDLVTFLNEEGRGPVLYMGGHQWSGEASQKLAARRTVLNTLFMISQDLVFRNDAGTDGDDPYIGIDPPHELTRSSPIVVDGPIVSGSPTAFSIQGSFVVPAPVNNVFFNPADPTVFNFPAFTGNVRVYDLSAISSSTQQFQNLTAVWAGGDHIPAAGSRNVYTSLASGTNYYKSLSRVDLTTANASTFTSMLGVSSNSVAQDLITQIRSAPLGGVDQSTPAYIEPSKKVTFTNNYKRPPFILSTSLDGMVRAFKSINIEDGTGAYGDELWAFLLPDQLNLIRTNDQGIQASPTIVDMYVDVYNNATGALGQDTLKEWITMLTLVAGETGNTVYAFDISNPDPTNTECYSSITNCPRGPRPLWSSQPTGMGNSTSVTMGLIDCHTTPKPIAVVATNDASASLGQGGIRVFALDATTGIEVWNFNHQYTRTIPNRVNEPNGVPATPVLVDRQGTVGCQTHVYVADYEGNLWELDATNGVSTTGSSPLWSASPSFSDPSTTLANYPIVAPMSLYRDSGQNLHILFATGGVYWAPSTSSIQQKIVDVKRLSSGVEHRVLATLDIGSRGYSGPLVVGNEVFVLTSAGQLDLLSSEMEIAGGKLERINLSTGASTTLIQASMSMASAGVSDSNRVVATSVQGVAVVANDGADQTPTKPDSETVGTIQSKLQLWVPQLK